MAALPGALGRLRPALEGAGEWAAANPGLAAAAALPLAALLLWLWWRAATLDLYKVPSANTRWPFLGILPDFWRTKDIAKLQLQYLEDLNKGPFMRLRAGPKVAVLVADPAAVAEVLARTGPNIVPRKVPEYATFDLATGLHGHHSILTEQNEPRWIAVRKALAPAYGTAAIRDNWPYIVNTYRTMGARIAAAIDAAAPARATAPRAAAKPAPAAAAAKVSVKAATASDSEEDAPAPDQYPAAANDITGVTSDGVTGDAVAGDASADVHLDHLALAASVQMQAEGLFRMPPERRKKVLDLQIAHDLEDVIGAVHHYSVAPWNKLIHFALPWATEAGRKMHPARQRLAAAFRVIYDHIMACPPPEPGDLTLGACLRRLRDPLTGQPPPEERLLAEVGNQIMAPETAAHTLSWMLYCVATDASTEARLIAELRSLGLPCDGDLEGALAALEAKGPDGLTPERAPFLNAVLNESMRMFPAGASASPRLIEKPTKVGPYLLPRGVMVFPCLYVVNNWSGNWEEPRKFKPERWLVAPGAPDPALDPKSGAPRFLPFSSGPKACIGGALGLVAVRTAAAALLSAFTFRLSERMGSPQDVLERTTLALTLKVEGGMWLRASRRAPAPSPEGATNGGGAGDAGAAGDADTGADVA